MDSLNVSRRKMLLGTGASLAALAATKAALPIAAQAVKPGEQLAPTPDQVRRMEWWHAAKFGMFIHFGLYSLHARHEWAMEQEAIPIGEYTALAREFNPKPGSQRAWAKLAKAAGMKYMVMTTKHHEGFCNFDTKLTDYCATKQVC
jgi:alpha-L-fucosidase